MDNIIQNIFDGITEEVKSDYVLLKMGSSTLPWVKKPRDCDYVFFFKKLPDEISAIRNLRNYKSNIPRGVSIIIHVDAIRTPKYPFWGYNILFAETLHGNKETLHLYKDMKEVFENPTEGIKRHIARDIHDSFFKVWCYTKHFDDNPKILYHVYIWKCLLEKGNLNLTEEEGKMVNDLHDRKFSKEELDRMKEGFEEFFRQYL